MGGNGRMDKQKVADSQAKTTQGKFIRRLSLQFTALQSKSIKYANTQIFKNQQHITKGKLTIKSKMNSNSLDYLFYKPEIIWNINIITNKNKNVEK